MSSKKPYYNNKNSQPSRHKTRSYRPKSEEQVRLDSNLLSLTPEQAKTELIQLIKEYSLFEGDSVLPSGKITTFYFDLTETFLSARGAFLAALCILNNLQDDVECLGGAIEHVSSLATAVSSLAMIRGQELDTFMVRQRNNARTTGYSKWIEGPLKPGARICLVHDEVFDGMKIIEAIRLLQEEAEVQVVQVIGVVDRLDGAKWRLQEYGVDYISLISVDELVDLRSNVR